jgi:hypothetical protein
MSYFADLTPHTYTSTKGLTVLNVGWLDSAHPFTTGETSANFHQLLQMLCESPVQLHRGFHDCQFCPKKLRSLKAAKIGNGQIRVIGDGGIWYVAPTMVYHYVTAHSYKPPDAFIDAVLKTASGCE